MAYYRMTHHTKLATSFFFCPLPFLLLCLELTFEQFLVVHQLVQPRTDPVAMCLGDHFTEYRILHLYAYNPISLGGIEATFNFTENNEVLVTAVCLYLHQSQDSVTLRGLMKG